MCWSKYCCEIWWGGRFILRNIFIRQKNIYWERRLYYWGFFPDSPKEKELFFIYLQGFGTTEGALAHKETHSCYDETQNVCRHTLPTSIPKALCMLLHTASPGSQVCEPHSRVLLTWILLIQLTHLYSMGFCDGRGLKHKEQHFHL